MPRRQFSNDPPAVRLADAELTRLHRVKQYAPPAPDAMGPELISFFKNAVQKRQGRLAHIAECWGRLVPDLLSAHCSLESLHSGSLTVLVDSASHLYELKQLLLAGLDRQLLLACRSTGLRKIKLKPGRWYTTDQAPRF